MSVSWSSEKEPVQDCERGRTVLLGWIQSGNWSRRRDDLEMRVGRFDGVVEGSPSVRGVGSSAKRGWNGKISFEKLERRVTEKKARRWDATRQV